MRSSALIEDRAGANFAGQFESFLGIAERGAFLTAVRACWAALWTTNARRYMENHGLNPGRHRHGGADPAAGRRARSGGGLSETAEGQMLISATWGLGSAIAQGEVVPDRIVLSRQGFLRKIEAGRKDHRETCGHGAAPAAGGAEELARAPCLDAGAGGHARPHDAQGRRRDRARRSRSNGRSTTRLQAAAGAAAARSSRSRAGRDLADASKLNGHPAGIGWGSGRAVVVNCECELVAGGAGRRAGDPGRRPALSHILPRVAGVVAELGGSTSHLASLARERGIPDGAGRARCHQPHPRRRPGRGRRRRRHRAVDRADAAPPRIFVTQPIAESAIERLREVATVRVNPDDSRIMPKRR